MLCIGRHAARHLYYSSYSLLEAIYVLDAAIVALMYAKNLGDYWNT